jgi:hypothetical protein
MRRVTRLSIRFIDETGGGVCHTAAAAGWAEAAPLAGEGDDAVVPAVIAVDAQEAVRGDAAIEKGAEVAHDEERYRATLHLPVGEEGGQMLRDRMVQRAFPCAVRPVCTRTHIESIARMALTQQPVRRTDAAPESTYRFLKLNAPSP